MTDQPEDHDALDALLSDYEAKAAEALAWRTEISEALGMTTWPEQGYTATLSEAVARIKEISAARDSWRADVMRHVCEHSPDSRRGTTQ